MITNLLNTVDYYYTVEQLEEIENEMMTVYNNLTSDEFIDDMLCELQKCDDDCGYCNSLDEDNSHKASYNEDCNNDIDDIDDNEIIIEEEDMFKGQDSEYYDQDQMRVSDFI